MDQATLKTEPLLQKENEKPNKAMYIVTVATILLFTPFYLFLAYESLSDLRNFIFTTTYYILFVPGMFIWTTALINERVNPVKAIKWGRASGVLFFIQLVVLPIASNEWWKKTGWEAVGFCVTIVSCFLLVVGLHAVYFLEPSPLVKDDDGSVNDCLPPEKMV